MKSLYRNVDIPKISWSEFLLNNIQKCDGNKIAFLDVASEKKYTYSDVLRLVTSLASALRRRGFKKGEVLCIYSANCIDYPITLLAAAVLGVIVTTANPGYTAEELLKQLKDSGACYLLFGAEVIERARKAGNEWRNIKEYFVFGNSQEYVSIQDLYIDDGTFFQYASIDPLNDILVLPYSSGTTGLPKGVMITHHNFVSTLLITTGPEVSLIKNPGKETYLLFLPMYHIYAQMVLEIGIYYGDTILVMSKFDFKQYLQTIQKYKVTTISVVPPVAVLLAKDPQVANYDLSSVRTALCGAAPLSRETQEEVLRKTGVQLKQGYGMTETGGIATVPISESFSDGCVGKLAPNIEGKIVDVITGKELGPNQDGELWVRGPNMMKGYINNQAATDLTTNKDGWVMTGDIAYYDTDGKFYIVDRLKELIKYKGLQVAPAELEALLLQHPAVLDVGVVGIPDENAGELPRAYVVAKKDTQISELAITKFVETQVSAHKRLRGGVKFVTEIPKSPSGKILRRLLRDLDETTKSKL